MARTLAFLVDDETADVLKKTAERLGNVVKIGGVDVLSAASLEIRTRQLR